MKGDDSMKQTSSKQNQNTVNSSLKPTILNISKAIFVVNKHAKTAPNPRFLYLMKKKAIEKLLDEGKAKKCGLHFSRNPKNSQQQSDLLISVGEYYFHIPPDKEDFKNLPHLGKLENSYRNPKTRMPLIQAKHLLESYTGLKSKSPNDQNKKPQQKYQKPVFKKLGESFF